MHFEACLKLGPAERSLQTVPASHVTGLIAVIASMWRAGGAIVVVPGFKAASFMALLQEERITHTLMVPATCACASRRSRTRNCRTGASAAMAGRRCRWPRSRKWGVASPA